MDPSQNAADVNTGYAAPAPVEVVKNVHTAPSNHYTHGYGYNNGHYGHGHGQDHGHGHGYTKSYTNKYVVPSYSHGHHYASPNYAYGHHHWSLIWNNLKKQFMALW